MTNLSIPSRLFHGRAKRQDLSALQSVHILSSRVESTSNIHVLLRATSNEPPPPYPPPPAFVPFSQNSIDPPIGLLQPFYRERLEKLGAPPVPIQDPTQPLPSPSGLTLPEDAPDPLKVKMGPLGQITVPTANTKPKIPKPTKPPGPGKGNGKKKGDDTGAGGGGSGAQGTPNQATNIAPQPGLAAPHPAGPTPNGVPPVTPSPTKRKSKGSKKKAGGEAPQAGPIVMATA